MLAEPDRTFGNRGVLWSALPTAYVNSVAPGEEETHCVGGSAEGLHVFPGGSVALVVESWTYLVGAQSHLRVGLVRFPSDGVPREYRRGDGTQYFELSESGRHAEALSSCSLPDGRIAVLLAQAPNTPGISRPWSYIIVLCDDTGQQLRLPLPSFQLLDPPGPIQPGSIRIAYDGTNVRVVSTLDTRVRLAGVNTGPITIDLTGSPGLPGLVRVDVASVRFDALGTASIAMTAYLSGPLLHPFDDESRSVAAVLRVQSDGHRDSAFADNGLWASPPTGDRFICAGEAGDLVAGCVGSRAVVYALDPSVMGGSGLDQSFAGGMAEHDLRGRLESPTMALAPDAVYVFAQRAPRLSWPGTPSRRSANQADLSCVGCRIRVAPGTPDHGTVDGGWATAGTFTIPADGAPIKPVATAFVPPRLVLAATRQIEGVDLDRIPMAVVLDAASGEPDTSFGASGFSLHGAVRQPVLVDADGSTTFVQRSKNSLFPHPWTAPPSVPALVLTNAEGEFEQLIPLPVLPAGAQVGGMTRLPDGGLLLAAGGGTDTWLMKLDASGRIDSTFGTDGVANPKPGGGQGTVRVLGTRTDGAIVIRIDTSISELAVVGADGNLDLSYGTSGYVEIRRYTHMGAGPNEAHCFLDGDGSVILAVSNEHAPGANPADDQYVRIALRRITPKGAYDSGFGLGQPSVHAPSTGQYQELQYPEGGSAGDDEFSKVTPAGIAWLGGRLYLVATGFSGGRWISQPGFNKRLPVYPLLLVLRWQSDGTVDSVWNGGRQEAGFDPDRLFWGASGVLQDSPTSLWVYGQAGQAQPVTSSITGGGTWTTNIVRQPQPALFRVEHPKGLDRTLGGDGAARIRLQEILLSPVAGTLVRGRPRVACVDGLQQPSGHPKTNLGGVLQWSVRPQSGRPWPPVIP